MKLYFILYRVETYSVSTHRTFFIAIKIIYSKIYEFFVCESCRYQLELIEWLGLKNYKIKIVLFDVKGVVWMNLWYLVQ